MGNHNDENPGSHETRDINLKAVAKFVVTLVIVLVCVHFVALGTLRFFIGHESKPAPVSFVKAPAAAPAGPGLLVNAPQHLRDLLTQEDQILNSSEWVDRSRGIARIPIDRAMDLVIERGLPKYVDAGAQPNAGGKGL